MSMSNLTAPVLGEKPGVGTVAGPAPAVGGYVGGVGGGFLIPVDTLLCVTRVVDVHERTGRLKVMLEPAIVGDGMNQVRVRVYNPTALHAHDLTSQGVVGPPGGGAFGLPGLNTLFDGAAVPPPMHTVLGAGATGIQNNAALLPGSEVVNATDLSTFTFDAETVGF